MLGMVSWDVPGQSSDNRTVGNTKNVVINGKSFPLKLLKVIPGNTPKINGVLHVQFYSLRSKFSIR